MLISKSRYLSLFNVFFFLTKYFIIFGKDEDQGHRDRGLPRTKDHILYFAIEQSILGLFFVWTRFSSLFLFLFFCYHGWSDCFVDDQLEVRWVFWWWLNIIFLLFSFIYVDDQWTRISNVHKEFLFWFCQYVLHRRQCISRCRQMAETLTC